MAAIPPPREGGLDQQPAQDNSSWRSTIDSWVKESAIRRDVLILVGMVLAATIVIVWIIFQASALASLLSTTVGKVVMGSVPVGLATRAGWKRLQRRRRHRHSAPRSVEPSHGPGPLAKDRGKAARSEAQRRRRPVKIPERGEAVAHSDHAPRIDSSGNRQSR